ncbi:MAG: DJ-1/PfpI family protein [Candidatus Krumholzibacteria bacterium]|nr:DJ-1/PfpI family protein [Candidatus Krumholzibacteria bacterium]
MKHVIVPLAPGFEEIEAVVIVDFLRRAGLRVTVAAVVGALPVTGSHGIVVVADARIEDADLGAADAIVLPGGVPGARNLGASEILRAALREAAAAGRLLGAICAAPAVLDAHGLLAGRRATSHPNHRAEMTNCTYVEERVVTDGHVVTSRGAGTAVEFAAQLVRCLVGETAADDILRAIQSR